MFTIGESWIPCSKINECGNDFMKNICDGIFFNTMGFNEQMKIYSYSHLMFIDCR